MKSRKLTIVSRLLQIIFLFNLFYIPLKLIYLWWLSEGKTLFGTATRYYLAPYPDIALQLPWKLPFLQRFSAFCVELVPTLCQMLLMFLLFRLFHNYQKGEIFSLRCIRLISAIGYTYLATQILSIIVRPVLLYVLTYHDQPLFILNFSSEDFSNIMVAFLVIIVSWVMHQGHQLKQDNDLTV